MPLLLLIAIGIVAIVIEVCCLTFCRKKWNRLISDYEGREEQAYAVPRRLQRDRGTGGEQ